MYSVVGYDKDGDAYETLWETDNLESAITQAMIFMERHRKQELRRKDNNEPFDWFEVIDTNDEEKVYWSPYTPPIGSCDCDEHENDNYWLGDSENKEEEEWCEIKEFPDYMVSNQGRVVNCTTNKVLKNGNDRYDSVELFHNGIGKRVSVHRLVSQYFVPGQDEGLVVNHIDGNKKNNEDSNLEWCTQGDNNRHAVLTGLNHPGAYQKHKVLVLETGKVFDGATECAKAIGGNVQNVDACLKRKRKSCQGFHFKYVDE